MDSIIGQIKSNLHQGDVVQLNVKNLYDAFAKDGECKLEHCEVLKDNQYYDIAAEHNKFAYGNDEHCTIEQVMDDGSVLFCTNIAENKSDRFALSPTEVAIAYFGRNSEVTRCSRCGSVCIPEVYTTGYGIYKDDKKYCFKCCGIIDGEKLDQLTPGETLHFYLSKKPGEKCKVTNWPGTFEVTCDYDIEGRHNLAGTRTDIGFTYHGRKFFWNPVRRQLRNRPYQGTQEPKVRLQCSPLGNLRWRRRREDYPGKGGQGRRCRGRS